MVDRHVGLLEQMKRPSATSASHGPPSAPRHPLVTHRQRSAVSRSSFANGAFYAPSARHCTESINRDKKAPQSLRGCEVGCVATLDYATRSISHGNLTAYIDLSGIDPRGGLTRRIRPNTGALVGAQNKS